MFRRLILSLIIQVSLFQLCEAPSLSFAAPHYSVEISPQSGSLSSRFIYSITINEQINGQPSMVTENDFSAQYLGPSQQVSIVNGAFSASTLFRYKLKAKREGDLQTPTFTIPTSTGLITIDPQPVTVSATALNDTSNTDPSNSGKAVRLKRTISPKTAYVGQQLLDTLEIKTAVPLREVRIDDAPLSGFVSTEISPDEQTNETHGNTNFTVVRKRRALFPIRSGSIALPGNTLHASAVIKNRRGPGLDLFDFNNFTDFFDNVEPIEEQSESLTITVLPLPEAPTDADFWGHEPLVGQTKLAITKDPKILDPGESTILTVTITSEGNLNQINSVNLPELPGMKVYPSPARSNQVVTEGKLVTTKEFQFTVIPTEGGNVTLPNLSLNYFDPVSQQYKSASTDEITILVTGSRSPKVEATEVPKHLEESPSAKNSSIEPEKTPNSQPIPEHQSQEDEAGWDSTKIILVMISLVSLFVAGFSLFSKSKKKNNTQVPSLIPIQTAQTPEDLLQILKHNLKRILGDDFNTIYDIDKFPISKTQKDELRTLFGAIEEVLYSKETSAISLEKLKIWSTEILVRFSHH